MDYKISKLGGWYIFLGGVELGPSFEEKLFSFLFCVIQLGNSVFKFKCDQIGNSDKAQLFSNVILVLRSS